MVPVAAGIAIWSVVLSVVAVGLYGLDKRAARHGRRRVPERLLHSVEGLGGWPGALLASRLFRHKNRKMRYRIIRACCVALHLAIVAGALTLVARG